MAKSRAFSIYLLKKDYNGTNALRSQHMLDGNIGAKGLPEGAKLFVLDSDPYPPWWKSYFNLEKDLAQVSKGAIVFLPVDDRYFALSFGHVAHNLNESSYEYDFGLRVTLNSLDPHKLKSIDTLDPGAAKRQRTQLPIESELTLFDFDRDSTILRNLTGKVRDEHKGLFRLATGSSNLRISTDIAPNGLIELCKKLLTLYHSDEYKTAFPNIQNIKPVRDPDLIAKLNDQLLKAFYARNTDLTITVPEMIDYSDHPYIAFSGVGTSSVYDEIYIERYYEYLDSHSVVLSDLGINELRQHMLLLTDGDGASRDRYSIFKSLVFDTTLEYEQSGTFHLCEGNWYRFDSAYIERLSNYLNPLCTKSDLPSYKHQSEGEYNKDIAVKDTSIACLDTKNISPDSQSQVEPCDLLAVRGDMAAFYHIKISTLSAQLSHLFNQGVNAIQLMRLEPQAVDKLEALIRNATKVCGPDRLINLIREQRYCIVFGIVTRKSPAGLSRNLPLFSRISLMRSMKALQSMGVLGKVMFIEDQSAASGGRKKKRKSRTYHKV